MMILALAAMFFCKKLLPARHGRRGGEATRVFEELALRKVLGSCCLGKRSYRVVTALTRTA